jgi:hypothetical protein
LRVFFVVGFARQIAQARHHVRFSLKTTCDTSPSHPHARSLFLTLYRLPQGVAKGQLAPLGAYTTPGAIGRQPESPKRTAPSPGFTKLNRMPSRGLVASGALANTGAFLTGNGPLWYERPGAFTPQVLSRKPNTPSFSFGAATRETVRA